LALTTNYGTDKFATLKTVLLHRPTYSLQDMNPLTMGYYLFDDIPDPGRYLEEHDRYRRLLQAHGVTTLELADYVKVTRPLMNTLASLPYLNDSSVISGKGAILSQMGGGRQGEEKVVAEALANLGIPVAYHFGGDDHFEGCLILPAGILFIACTERHRRASVEKFLPAAVAMFAEVIYVECPKARRFMHADMIYGQVSETLALAFPPAFLETYSITAKGAEAVDFTRHMARRGIEVLAIADEEQKKWGCSFMPLAPGRIIHYDIALAAATVKALHAKGTEIIEFHPDALLAGGGSLRCLTLQLLRE
jgi:arginine deiminase